MVGTLTDSRPESENSDRRLAPRRARLAIEADFNVPGFALHGYQFR
jgi:hypothetical protein